VLLPLQRMVAQDRDGLLARVGAGSTGGGFDELVLAGDRTCMRNTRRSSETSTIGDRTLGDMIQLTMKALLSPLSIALLLSFISCRSTTLDMTKLRRPVMLNPCPMQVDATKQQPAPYRGTSWTWGAAFTHGHDNQWQKDAVSVADMLFRDGWQGIFGARIKVLSESSLPILAVVHYVEITVEGEAHK